MGSTIFIVWRETIEAMLVVGILYTWLKNQSIDNSQAARQGMRFLWGGVLAGIALAIALAFIMLEVQSELASEALQYFQIVIVLLACVLITQMVLWMRRHGQTMKQDLEYGLQQAQDQANWWAMAGLAAIAVGREGAETVIFLYGTGLSQQYSLLPFILSASSGFILAFLSFWVLSKGTRYFSWHVFFRISEILLLLLASALLVDGIDHLIGLGWIPALVDPLWNSTFLLDDSSRIGSIVSAFTGYRAYPALMLLIVYALYWLLVIFLLHRSTPMKAVKK